MKLGARGEPVRRWQQILVRDGAAIAIDGIFGPLTKESTEEWQLRHGLAVTGVVGALEVKLAMKPALPPPLTPPFPWWKPLTPITDLDAELGVLRWEPCPQPGFLEAISITNGWATDHIVKAVIPQVAKIPGYTYQGIIVGRGNRHGIVLCHRRIVGSLTTMFARWEEAGLLHLVLTIDGLWVPRTIRRTNPKKPVRSLSNHARGIAIDLNARWNMRGVTPPAVGAYGSMRELLEIAHDCGYDWGGEIFDIPDGMHLQAAMEALDMPLAA